nr:hypothetical protein [Cellulosimicrobium composti]
MIQAARNQPRDGASATATTAMLARTDPVVITARGPWRSMRLPTMTPAPAATTSAAEKAAVALACDQPVSAVMAGNATGKE